MGAISDLWKSERGIVAIVGLALVTTMFQLENITADQWESLLKWIITGYTAGKSATGVAEVLARGKDAEPKPMPSGESAA